MKFSDNPVFARLTHDARWPSLAASRWIALGLAVVTLAVSLVDCVRVLESLAEPWASAILGAAGWLIALFLPPACAITAAIIARRSITEDEIDLLRLTRVTPTQFVSGLIGGAFFRLRWPIILLAGLLPAIILGSSNVFTFGLHMASLFPPFFPFPEYQPAALDVIVLAAQVATTGLGLGIFSPVCAALGVMLGRGYRSPVPAVLGAVGGSLVWAAAVVILIIPIISELVASQADIPVHRALLSAVLCLLPPLFLTPVALWLAHLRVFRGAK